MIHTHQQGEALHRSIFAMIIIPIFPLVLVGVGLLLNGIIKKQNLIFPFRLAHRGLDI